MTASHEGRYPEPLDSFTADLIRLERMQREIRKTLGAESQKIIDSVLADEADLPSRVFDLLHDLVMNKSEIIKSFTGLGDYGEFGINVMKFGGVYWVQAAEFDDIGPGRNSDVHQATVCHPLNRQDD